MFSPINFKNWIDENRHLLKPPVGNKVVYENTEFIIMVVGGPNTRKDYHIDKGEEFFYQLEGGMILRIIENGKQKILISTSIILRRPKMIEKWWKIICWPCTKFIKWLAKGLPNKNDKV